MFPLSLVEIKREKSCLHFLLMEERLHAQTAFVGHLENIFKDGTPNFCYSKEVL